MGTSSSHFALAGIVSLSLYTIMDRKKHNF